MTPPFDLDASALFAHCLEEPGSDIVENIIEQFPNDTYISAMTWLEFQVRLEEIYPDTDARREILACYAELLNDPEPVTKEVVSVALEMRGQAGRRLPNADAIIAATAKLHGAALVHRDPHYAAIPEKLLRQIILPEKIKPAP
jgi:predicted nucleic acid-binding protein